MRINLDGGYVEIRHSSNPGKFIVIVAATNSFANTNDNIVNAAEITSDQFNELISDVTAAQLTNVEVKFEEKKPVKNKATKKTTKKTAKKKPVESDEDSSSSNT